MSIAKNVRRHDAVKAQQLERGDPLACMTFSSSRIQRITPSRFTAITRRHCSNSVSAIVEPENAMPALLIA